MSRGADLGTRERDTLLKLVLGMVMARYRYSPEAPRNGAPIEIRNDLAKLAMSVDDDTIRKRLKEAVQTVLPARPPNT